MSEFINGPWFFSQQTQTRSWFDLFPLQDNRFFWIFVLVIIVLIIMCSSPLPHSLIFPVCILYSRLSKHRNSCYYISEEKNCRNYQLSIIKLKYLLPFFLTLFVSSQLFLRLHEFMCDIRIFSTYFLECASFAYLMFRFIFFL